MDFLAGYAAFHWVATWANPGFDAFFRAVTDMGSHTLYYLVCAPLFWVVDRRRASMLFLLVLLSAYVNTAAKLGFHTPRPDPAMARVIDLRPFQAQNPSFPSGHTQGAVVFWSFVALWIARRWMSVIAAAMIVLIAFSRIYLGAHFPIDVAGGLVLGGLTMLIAPPLVYRWAERNFHGSTPLVAGAAVISVVATALTGDPSLAMLSGCFLGFFLGTVWLPQPPTMIGTIAQRALAAVAGILLILPFAGFLQSLSQQPLALFVAVTLLWVATLWAYPHALARPLPVQVAPAELE